MIVAQMIYYIIYKTVGCIIATGGRIYAVTEGNYYPSSSDYSDILI